MVIYWIFQMVSKNPLFVIPILIFLTFLLFSIVIHELSHGWVAYKFGDPTPKEQGRLTLNPFAHLDPVGTLMLFIIGLGWAKPVEINPENIHGKTKQMLVALAGPGSNFILAIIFSFILYGVVKYAQISGIVMEQSAWSVIVSLIRLVIEINIILGLFNMLPIPPLDGSNVIRWFLPQNLANAYARLAPFGMVILLLLLFTVGFRFIFIAARTIEQFLFRIIEFILNPIFGLLTVI